MLEYRDKITESMPMSKYVWTVGVYSHFCNLKLMEMFEKHWLLMCTYFIVLTITQFRLFYQSQFSTAAIQGIWCGDFNAHNSLWGSEHTDNNGIVIEEMIDTRNLCLSFLLTANLARLCEWKVSSYNIGSDHFPIVCTTYIKYCYIFPRK